MGKIQGLLIASLLASGILMGLTGFLGDMSNKYSFTGNSSALENLNVINTVSTELNSTRGTIQGGYIEDLGGNTPWTGAWNSALTFLNLPNIFINMVSEIFGFNNYMQLPNWLNGLIWALLTSVFIFAVFRIFTGRDA